MNTFPKTAEEAAKCRYGISSFGGSSYNPSQCAFECWKSLGRGSMYHQCTRKPGKGPGGLYCATHAPEAAEKCGEATFEAWFKVRDIHNKIEEAQVIKSTAAKVWLKGGRMEDKHSGCGSYFPTKALADAHFDSLLAKAIRDTSSSIQHLTEQLEKYRKMKEGRKP